MSKLLKAQQMRAIETAAIESGQVTGLALMERAGRGVVEAVFEHWPDLAATSYRVVILCGPGNNGGDGFVIARLLKHWGWEVAVYLYGEANALPPDAKVNYERWCEIGAVDPLVPIPEADFWHCDLIVDALFGTGLTRPLQGVDELIYGIVQCADAWDMEHHGPRVVAVDIASGICADSGRELRAEKSYTNGSVEANLTVTFHRAKIGHYCTDGFAAHRALVVKDIGLSGDGTVRLLDEAYLFGLTKHHLEHKYIHGHAAILTGGFGKTGAARLAARGALRCGAGLVTLCAPEDAQSEVAGQITALMMEQVDDASALAAVMKDRRINVLCLGPGMGQERARALAPVALNAHHKPSVVLDADALTAFEDDPDVLFEMLHKGCVLTPHAGEFARLFPDIAEQLGECAAQGPAYSRVDACRDAAERAGCVVLLKGPDTVIASSDGRCAINSAQYERSAPWLATAGSGDVLAGFITGLIARGIWPMEAAAMGAFLHVECARQFGPGLIAEDLPEQLPAVFRNLGR